MSYALFAEAAALTAAGIAIIADLAVRGGTAVGSVGMAVFIVVCAFGLAWLLTVAGRGLPRRGRMSRSIAMMWQIFQGIIAASALTAGEPVAVIIGVLLLASALFVAVVLLLPRVVEATTRG
jgi:hypothetical protein